MRRKMKAFMLSFMAAAVLTVSMNSGEAFAKEAASKTTTNTAAANAKKTSVNSKVTQKPLQIIEPEPTIKTGQALLKINFKLPAGTVMEGEQTFTIICDTVSSNGKSKREYKNIFLIKGANSYTAFMPVDASSGSSSCKIYYQAYDASGYLSGILTDKGTEVMTGELSSETDNRKKINAKEGSVTEISLNAIKGILFSTKIKWAASTDITLKPSFVSVKLTEKSKDGKEENSKTTTYYFEGNEKDIVYTLAQDKEYSLAFYNKLANFYYVYGNITIDSKAKKEGKLAYQPISMYYETGKMGKSQSNPFLVSDLPKNKRQLLQKKIKDIISKIIKPGMSDIDKEYAIFKYIQDNTLYGFSQNCGNAYGSLIENIGVCDGYAEGTKMLLDAAGIENVIAYGTKGNGVDAAPHAWNIVKVGDEYFHLDALQNRFNMNDTDAKDEYYTWQQGSLPKCSSRFSIRQGLSFFIYDGYIYYTSRDNNFSFDINRCRPDGSENTKQFTTNNSGTFILQEKGWIYYFDYEGSKVFKVKTDGSGEALFYSFDDGTRIHDGGITNNTLYLLVQTGVGGVYEKSIKKIDLESSNVTTIATFGEDMNLWKVGDYFYYYRMENGQLSYYKMTLDGSVETLVSEINR